MTDLSNLNDKQSLLLTQLSYSSDRLPKDYKGRSISKIYDFAINSEADDNVISCLKELCDNDLGDLRITSVGNNSVSGFGAVAFSDSKGNTGISYRGTDGVSLESINDWADNVAALINGTSVQSMEAEKFFCKNMNSSGNNFLFGHSKGGELSESVYVNHYDEIKRIHLLNPQPINPYSLSGDQILAMQSSKVDIVVNEGDYVWFLGTVPTFNMRIAKTNDENAHLFGATQFDENGSIVSGQQPIWEYPAYIAVSALTYMTQLYGAVSGILYNSIVRVINFVSGGHADKAYEYIKLFAKGILSFGTEMLDFSNQLSEFLIQTIARAQKIYNKNQLITAQNQTSCSTEIRVDTYSLRYYANRLGKVKQRANDLNDRIENLYRRTGLKDLQELIQLDTLSKQDYKLKQCIAYLNDTADDFDNAERVIAKML